MAKALNVTTRWLETGTVADCPPWAQPDELTRLLTLLPPNLREKAAHGDLAQAGPLLPGPEIFLRLQYAELLLAVHRAKGPNAPDDPPPRLAPTLVVSSTPNAIPIGGTVTAGDGWAMDTAEGMIHMRDGLVAVKVQGDSAEPLAMSGQYVLADPSRSGDDIPLEAVVVVQTGDGQAYCKRFAGIHAGQMFLVSINQGRKSVIVPAAQATAWEVVGVLFANAVKYHRATHRQSRAAEPSTQYDRAEP